MNQKRRRGKRGTRTAPSSPRTRLAAPAARLAPYPHLFCDAAPAPLHGQGSADKGGAERCGGMHGRGRNGRRNRTQQRQALAARGRRVCADGTAALAAPQGQRRIGERRAGLPNRQCQPLRLCREKIGVSMAGEAISPASGAPTPGGSATTRCGVRTCRESGAEGCRSSDAGAARATALTSSDLGITIFPGNLLWRAAPG
jgi:hypothetical protein